MLDAATSVAAGGGGSGWINGGGADIGAPLVRPWEKPFEKSPAALAGGPEESADVGGPAGIEAAGTAGVLDDRPVMGLGTDGAGLEVGNFGPGMPVGDPGGTGGRTTPPGIEGVLLALGVASPGFGMTAAPEEFSSG